MQVLELTSKSPPVEAWYTIRGLGPAVAVQNLACFLGVPLVPSSTARAYQVSDAVL